jgi:undecaprenyl diphosphate synthase
MPTTPITNSQANSQADPLADVPVDRRPRHIAMIMDGNGRWAQRQGQPRIFGHQNGATTVRTITEEAAKLQLEQLTLYCLSSENWKRPADELEFLLQLLSQFLITERETLMRNNVRLKIIGRRERIPAEVQSEMDRTLEMTSENSGTTLCLAINYGSRGEIVDAVRTIGQSIKNGSLDPDDVSEDLISQHLYTAGMSDPDLLVRTAGERRISNYLLWQISYAEIWVTEKLWPDFATEDLHQAIRNYSHRTRRFGGLVHAAAETDVADSHNDEG